MARTVKPRITLDPAATPEQRAAYIASLSKRERVALLRAMSGPLGVSRDEAEATRTARREWAKGV